MAESVDAALEGMVPALQDLLSKGVFNESEIRSIVNRRRHYEYLIRRRQARKADFLTYIEDEIQLERLRSLRNRKLLSKKKYQEEQMQKQKKAGKGRHGDKKSSSTSSIGDASIIQNIHLIYVRAIRKWRDDVLLHLDHANFAKSAKSWKRLGRIYAEALQVHPHNIALWIEAASYEYFGHASDVEDGGSSQGRNSAVSAASVGGSVANARVLLQRGLRANPRSKDLWLQYFALEFHYIQKLRGRREILQLGLNKKGLGETAANDDDVGSSSEIPLVIFKNAIKSIPDDVQFRLKFVDLCRMFPETEGIESLIMSTVDSDFAGTPLAWIARAEYADSGNIECENGFITSTGKNCFDGSNDKAVYRILEKATDSIATSKMYLVAIHFVKTKLVRDEEYDSKANVAFLGRMFTKASDSGISSSDLLLEQSKYLVSIGDVTSAIDLLEEAIIDPNSKYSKEACLWLELANVIQRVDCESVRRGGAVAILEKALTRIPINDARHVDVAVALFKSMLLSHANGSSKAKKRLVEKIHTVFERILLLSVGSNERRAGHSIPQLGFMYLQHSQITGAVAAARRAYGSILFESNYTKGEGFDDNDLVAMKMLFDVCISLEQINACPGESVLLCKLYDAASGFFKRSNKTSWASEFKQRRNRDKLTQGQRNKL